MSTTADWSKTKSPLAGLTCNKLCEVLVEIFLKIFDTIFTILKLTIDWICSLFIY